MFGCGSNARVTVVPTFQTDAYRFNIQHLYKRHSA